MPNGTQVASLFGVLSLEDTDFQRGLKDADKGLKTAQDRVKDFSAGIKNVGAGLIAVSGPVVAFGVSAVKAAMESQQAVAQLDAVIKSTGGSAGITSDHAQALAASFQTMTTYSDEATMSAESMLLTFTNIGANGGVFDQATLTALNMSTALGQDLTSSAMQLGKALNNPIDGITALTRVGVTFSEEQKKTIQSMMDVGNVAGAQGVILAELNKEFGGSAFAAGNTFTGQLEILKNKFGEVQEKIGNVFLPVLSDLVTKGISPVVNQILRWVGQNPQLVLQIGAVALGGLALGGALVVIGMVLPAVVTGLGLLLSPVVLLALALGAVVYAAATLYPGGISKLLSDAGKAAQDLAHIGLIVLIDTLNKAAISATLLVGIVQIFLIQTLNNASLAAQAIVKDVQSWIDTNAELMKRLFDLGLTLVVVGLGIKIYTGVMALAAIATGVGSGLAGAVTAAGGALLGIGATMLATIIPLLALVAVVYTAIAAFHKLIDLRNEAINAVKDQTANAAPGIKANNLSLQDVKDKAFAETVAQGGGGVFGDLKARLLWGSGTVNMDQRVTDLYNGAQAINNVGQRQMVPQRAGGGPVSAGGSYLVGEQGPEMFTPSSNGNISTASQTAAMMGGSTYNLTIYANDYAGGQAAGRGFMDAARAKGW